MLFANSALAPRLVRHVLRKWTEAAVHALYIQNIPRVEMPSPRPGLGERIHTPPIASLDFVPRSFQAPFTISGERPQQNAGCGDRECDFLGYGQAAADAADYEERFSVRVGGGCGSAASESPDASRQG